MYCFLVETSTPFLPRNCWKWSALGFCLKATNQWHRTCLLHVALGGRLGKYLIIHVSLCNHSNISVALSLWLDSWCTPLEGDLHWQREHFVCNCSPCLTLVLLLLLLLPSTTSWWFDKCSTHSLSVHICLPLTVPADLWSFLQEVNTQNSYQISWSDVWCFYLLPWFCLHCSPQDFGWGWNFAPVVSELATDQAQPCSTAPF